MPLTLDELTTAVGSAAGIRAVTDLEPLGGAGDKVFPPTYSVRDAEATQYAVERRIGDDGRDAEQSVVLDSVASQANRMEEVLLELIRTGQLGAPVTAVDFAAAGLVDLDRVSDYEAPHRIFDAILRDAFDGEELFRNGPVGRLITEASSRNCAALVHHSPHTLLFGGWDSTGPKGGRGAKYERAITSEIVAHGVERGVKTGSRLDPLGIERQAGTVYESASDVGWTLDPAEAVRDGRGPEPYNRAGRDDVGRPSQLNHGNVTPSIERRAGGITAHRIIATTTISFIQLRRLRLPTGADGAQLSGGGRSRAELTARTALAALGLVAATAGFEAGLDLRSRCVLVPTTALVFELIAGPGDRRAVEITAAEALDLVHEASTAAAAAGVGWRDGERTLRPSPRLVDLVRRSQDVSVATPATVDEAAPAADTV